METPLEPGLHLPLLTNMDRCFTTLSCLNFHLPFYLASFFLSSFFQQWLEWGKWDVLRRFLLRFFQNSPLHFVWNIPHSRHTRWKHFNSKYCQYLSIKKNIIWDSWDAWDSLALYFNLKQFRFNSLQIFYPYFQYYFFNSFVSFFKAFGFFDSSFFCLYLNEWRV